MYANEDDAVRAMEAGNNGLLEKIFKANRPSNEWLNRVLGAAVSDGKVGRVAVLVKYGATPDVRDYQSSVRFRRGKIHRAFEEYMRPYPPHFSGSGHAIPYDRYSTYSSAKPYEDIAKILLSTGLLPDPLPTLAKVNEVVWDREELDYDDIFNAYQVAHVKLCGCSRVPFDREAFLGKLDSWWCVNWLTGDDTRAQVLAIRNLVARLPDGVTNADVLTGVCHLNYPESSEVPLLHAIDSGPLIEALTGLLGLTEKASKCVRKKVLSELVWVVNDRLIYKPVPVVVKSKTADPEKKEEAAPAATLAATSAPTSTLLSPGSEVAEQLESAKRLGKMLPLEVSCE